jgi:hypothetical protein
MQQCNQYPASGASQSVTQSNSTTSWVYIVRAETEDLGIRLDDGGESLVELPDGNVVL